MKRRTKRPLRRRDATAAVGALGRGIGWRPELALAIDRRADLQFVELTAEGFPEGTPVPEPVVVLQERGVHVVVHGLGLSLGGAERPSRDRLRRLERLADATNAVLISEHIAFVRGGGLESGHLLPIPRTRDAIDILVSNVLEAQEALSRRLALENVAALFEWPAGEMDEADFLSEIVHRTGSLLLLDIENVYANARNHSYDPVAFLDRIPLQQIAYVHIAGGVEQDGIYHDTHGHDVPAEVLSLLEELCARVDVPGVMLERDSHFPSADGLNRELDAIAAAVSRGAQRRGVVHEHA